jgi:hypothetical protein
MKVKVNAIAMLTMMTVGFTTVATSCSNNDDVPASYQPSVLAKSLEGEWIVEQSISGTRGFEQMAGDKYLPQEADQYTLIYHFNNDGTGWKEFDLLNNGQVESILISRYESHFNYMVNNQNMVILNYTDGSGKPTGQMGDLLFDGKTLTDKVNGTPVPLNPSTEAQINKYKSEADAWHGGSAEEGYVLTVNVNVTRHSIEADRKQEFSTGDKLFVSGSHGDAGKFAGTLTWQSGGKFSGTITTEKKYSGEVNDLLSSAAATLLPAGYENYGYLSVSESGYKAHVCYDKNKAITTDSKATAVEQFSLEQCNYTSGVGFTLEPHNAILNFTIIGLTPNAYNTVNMVYAGMFDISKTVSVDRVGTATFAIGVEGNTDLNNVSLKVANKSIILFKESTKVSAGKTYDIGRNTDPASPFAGVTTEDLGKVIGANGKIYADAAAATTAGTTAVAMIVYVGSDNGEAAPYNHGLALALSDAMRTYPCIWKTSNTKAGHTNQTNSKRFTSESGLQYNATHNTPEYIAFLAAIANNGTTSPAGCSSWFLASCYQWTKILNANGISKLLTTANGFKGMGSACHYWTSSERDADGAWYYSFPDACFASDSKSYKFQVRSCLAF